MKTHTFPFQKLIESTILILLGIFVACLPYGWYQMSYLLGIACGLAILDRIFFLKFSEFKTITWRQYALCFMPMVVLYLLDLTGMLYTSAPEVGRFVLEKHMSLFAFPLLFITLGPNFFSLKALKIFGLLFCIGCIGVIVIYLYNLFTADSYPEMMAYKEQGQWLAYLNAFLPNPRRFEHIPFLMHHTFQAWHMLTAMTLMAWSWILWPQWYQAWYWKLLNIVSLLLFLGVGVLLAESKMGYLALVLWIVGTSVLLIVKNHYKAVVFGFLTVAGLALVCFSIPNMQSLMARFHHSLVENVLMYNASDDATIQDESVYPRLKIWQESVECIKQKPFLGWGTGGEKSEAVLARPVMGRYLGNAHNQFLAYGIRFGLLGLFLFVGAWGFWFFNAISRKNLLFAAFLSLAFCFMLTDVAFELQIGITFFCMFYGLLTALSKYTDPKYPNPPIAG